ncbi:hypothetical protein L1887_07880 [Cichorium endivia]|nr:hypothetical protein L1887_07880 [Cichorium endivia]
MSMPFQNLITRHSHTHTSIRLNPPNLKSPKFDVTNFPHFQTLKTRVAIPFKLRSVHTQRHYSIRAIQSDGVVDKQYIVAADTFDVDAFLSIAEFFCLASSAVISIGFVINSRFSASQKPVLEWFGNRATVWQSLLLVVGIVIGAAIRRRQWRRICLGFSKSGSSGVNLVERIEKVEEDLRNSATIIRVLSRQLEKLGIRFRVTRKSMKEPIAQTAELAQKNSEATRALAMQEDILEKELAEIQKVLLAMQDQQQKQLELILAIAKSGKLWDNNKPVPPQDQKKAETSPLTGGGSKSDGNR